MREDSENFALIVLVIIIIGLIGNTLNLIVFSHRTMVKNSTFNFLFYLSIVDMLVLSVCTSDTFLTYGYYILIRSYSIYICRIHTFLTYFLTHMSSIVLMVVSIDRALIICNKKVSTLMLFRRGTRLLDKPGSSSIYQSIANKINVEKRHTISDLIPKIKLKKIEKLIILIAILLALFNIHFLVFMNINVYWDPISDDQNLSDLNTSTRDYQTNSSIKYKHFIANQVKEVYKNYSFNLTTARKAYICSPLPDSLYMNFMDKIWIWVDMCLYSLIPFIVMALCSLIIIREIRQKSSLPLLSNFLTSNQQLMKKRSKRNKQLLLILVITNSYFFVTSLPLCIMMVYYKMYDQDESEAHFSQTLLHVLAYSNNAVNFAFCLLFSQKYRLLIKNMIINTIKSSKVSTKTINF
jgi:hypothetical protein